MQKNCCRVWIKLIGQKKEQQAADWLRKQGYEILAENYLCRGGEIDLIGFIHATVSFVYISRFMGFAALIVTLLVMIVELLNSAVEATIDRISSERHPLSKVAKDTASAAVSLSLLLWVFTWGSILLPRWVV